MGHRVCIDFCESDWLELSIQLSQPLQLKDFTEVAQFLNDTMIYMDGLDWIERYAWFGYFVCFTLYFFLITPADLDISSVLRKNIYTVCSLHTMHVSPSTDLLQTSWTARVL